MTAQAWVTLVAGVISGGALGTALGYWLGSRSAFQKTITASAQAQVAAETTAAKARDQIDADAAALQKKITTQGAADIADDLEHLP